MFLKIKCFFSLIKEEVFNLYIFLNLSYRSLNNCNLLVDHMTLSDPNPKNMVCESSQWIIKTQQK